MLQIKDVRNQELNKIQFAPFSVVIAKVNSKNEFTTAVNFGTLKNNKEITIYMEVIRYQLAESDAMKELLEGLEVLSFKYKKVDGKEAINKGYSAKGNYIAKHLRTAVIYTTNKEGYINNTVKAKECTFADTMLNLNRCKGLIYSYIQAQIGVKTAKEFTNDLYMLAKKVSLQSNYFTNVNDKVKAFSSLCEKEVEKEAKEKAEKEAKEKAAKEAKEKAEKEAKKAAKEATEKAAKEAAKEAKKATEKAAKEAAKEAKKAA